MVLGLLYDQATYLKGVVYLIFYNAVFILPLAAVLAVAGNEAVLSKLDTWRKEHSRAMRIWSSAAMIILGLLILTL
jgi:cytochrome c biogenesis protein CcdA